jgi:pSer/pThr/pTyr-binding forkhead associated (FHA) protein
MRTPFRLQVPPERRITIGRSGGNQLSIDDPSISKFHASISIASDGSTSVADTGSTNGTFINGERIAYGKSVAFGLDDTLKFGAVEVTIKTETEPDPVEAHEPEQLSHKGTGSARSGMRSSKESEFEQTVRDPSGHLTDEPEQEIG